MSEQKSIELSLTWLKAALECAKFIWDADQHEAATETLADATKELAALQVLRMQAEARITDLERENMRLIAECNDHAERVDQLKPDAARYRWLKDNDPMSIRAAAWKVPAAQTDEAKVRRHLTLSK